jgi:hypothetical protein
VLAILTVLAVAETRNRLTQTATAISPLRPRGVVLLVGDMLAPGRAAALIVDLEHRDVGHEAVGRGAVPVLLAGLEEDAVARAG